MRCCLPGELPGKLAAAATEGPGGGGTVASAGAAELNGATSEITRAEAIMTRARLLPVAFKSPPPGIARGLRNLLTSAFPAWSKAFPAWLNPNQCHVCTAGRATRYAQPSVFALIREDEGGLAGPAGTGGCRQRAASRSARSAKFH